MLVIPAIDLQDGRCVRLRQGRMDEATVFSEDPAGMARYWVDAGAERLHLVDLNGAYQGRPVNDTAIRNIAAEVRPLPLQVGGGIRTLNTIEAFLEAGVTYVVLGTSAVRNPSLVRQACAEFPGRVMVGFDVRDGRVAVEGWAKLSDQTAADLGRRFEDYGIEAIVYTDIQRDGMLTGPNVEAIAEFAQPLRIPVIASGGITTLDDLRALRAEEDSGIAGAILGRAIYEGSLAVEEAVKVARGHAS